MVEIPWIIFDYPYFLGFQKLRICNEDRTDNEASDMLCQNKVRT